MPWADNVSLVLSAVVRLYWILEILALNHVVLVWLQLTGYFTIHIIIFGFIVYANIAVKSRELFQLRRLMRRRRKALLILATRYGQRFLSTLVHRYWIELWRTIKFVQAINSSVFGGRSTLLMLVLNIPVNIVLFNMILWRVVGDDWLANLLVRVLFLLQTFALFAACNVFALVSQMIHSTSSCFVPLQAWLRHRGGGSLRGKLHLMVLHELVATRRWKITLSLMGTAPVTKKSMFKVGYLLWFL